MADTAEVKEIKEVKRQPVVGKTKKGQPKSFTTVRDWVIWGFIVSVLAQRIYVLVYVPAMSIVQVPNRVTCPVHQSDPMEEGLLPTRYQTGFGKAAWHIPRHWKTWMSTQIFQKQGWLNTPLADNQRMNKIQLEIKSQLPKLMEEEDNLPLVATLQSLTKETESMAACLGGDASARNREQRVARISSMSIDCRLKILWQWDTMQNLALVLASTENIVTANKKRLDDVRKLRATIADGRGLIARLQQKTAANLAKTDNRVLESALTWFNTTDFSEQYRVHSKYRDAQKQYMHLTWLDLIYASLDGLLYTKEQQITHIMQALHDYDLTETLASVKHGITTSPLQNARNGVVDTLPYRTALFLEELRQNTTIANEHAIRRASCHWMQTHAPLLQKCTCGETVGMRAWRVGWASKDQVQKWTKQHLRHMFWNELEDVKIWYDNSTEKGQRADGAEVKQRTPDIRTMGFCRAKGDKSRPFNP